MTEIQARIIRHLADNKMVVAEVARIMHSSPSTIRSHIAVIRERTGKDPLNFRDLGERLDLVERGKELATCKICGRKFETERRHHQYIRICSEECREIVEEEHRQRKLEYLRRRREEDKEYQRQQKLEGNKKPKPIRLTVFPSMSLAEVNEKARAAGMSYGKFVALWRGT